MSSAPSRQEAGIIQPVEAQQHSHDHDHEAPAASSMRRGGRRLTRQRAAIWAVLTADSDAHLSADEVAQRVRVRLPAVNPSTVYRTLDVLVEDGLVRRTNLGGDRAYYEPVHEHRHHHLVCERCGGVVHLHDDVLNGIDARVLEASGFVLGAHEVTLFGLCRECWNVSTPATRGETMADDHDHDEAHSHEHSHGDVTHSHAHDEHDHEHTEHEHEHSHGDVTHSHTHAHESGVEDDHEHSH